MSEYRELTLENALLLMKILGWKRLPLKEIPSPKGLGARMRGDGSNPMQKIGRATVFYEDGTIKTFFEGNPLSESSAKARDASQEEISRIVPYLRGLLRERVIEDLIDDIMRVHDGRHNLP